MNSVEINSIVYVLNPSPPKLIPGRIVEQIISRKLEGEQTMHVVKFSNGKDYTLEKIEKPWFTSLEAAGLYLTKEAEKLVDSVLKEGLSQTKKHFPDLDKPEDFRPYSMLGLENSPEMIPDIPAEAPDINNTPEESLIVDLGGGQKAKVKLPKVLE